MKKRVICILLVVVLLNGLGLPVYAAKDLATELAESEYEAGDDTYVVESPVDPSSDYVIETEPTPSEGQSDYFAEEDNSEQIVPIEPESPDEESSSDEEYVDTQDQIETVETEPVVPAVYEPPTSGECGDRGGNVKWEYSNGTLYISGSGAMEDFRYEAPWRELYYEVSNIVIENGITHIGDFAFQNQNWADVATSISIPDSVLSIGELALSGMILTSLTIPKHVAVLGEAALEGIEVPGIDVAEGNPSYSSKDGVVFSREKTKLIAFPIRQQDVYTIPDSVTTVASGAFTYCEAQEIVISDSVIEIEDYGFNQSRSVKYTLGENLRTIGACGFYGCDAKKIVVPKSVEKIGANAFSSSDLEKITILNPSCIIDPGQTVWGWDTLGEPGKTVVVGYKDSTAEQFAKGHGFSFDYIAEGADYFQLRRDNGNFINTNSHFFGASEAKNYSTSFSSYLLSGLDKTEDSAYYYSLIEAMQDNWGGACLGISISEALNYSGRLFSPENYWNLGKPVSNNSLRNVIHFYQLLQHRPEFRADLEVYKNPNYTSTASFPGLLKGLTEEAKKSAAGELPFVFIFRWDNTYGSAGGHAVVICGYEFGDFDGQRNVHRIKVCDPNDNQRFYYLYVSEDYSSFSYQTSFGFDLAHNWASLGYLGSDTLRYQPLYFLSLKGGNGAYGQGSGGGFRQILVPVDKSFSVKNAEGETLTYNGSTIGGTMDVYSARLVGEENVELVLTVSPSEEYLVTGFGNDFEIAASVGNQYYSATTEGADSIQLSNEDGVVFEGDQYSFSAAVGVNMTSCDIVKVSGNADNTCKIVTSSDGVAFVGESTNTTLSGVTVGLYQGATYEETKISDEQVKQLEIKDDGNGQADVVVDGNTSHDQPGGDGWFTDANGDTYYYRNGKALKGWNFVEYEWYYFDNSGRMVTGDWAQDKYGWYFLGTDGKMLSGFREIDLGRSDDGWYFFNTQHDGSFGRVLSGWQYISGEWYYFNEKHDGTYGRMVAGDWAMDGKYWYFLGMDGKMLVGLREIALGRSDDGLYYFNEKHDGTYGRMMTGWQWVNDDLYYFETRHNGTYGRAFRNSVWSINGWLCAFDEDGICYFREYLGW